MKVLIISHNPITTYGAMGKTLYSLFSYFKKEELCQLYIYPTIPDISVCSSYYRITDKDILASYRTFKVRGREIMDCEIQNTKSILFEDEKDEKLYRNRKNKKPVRMLARDVMWKFSGWYNRELREWIKMQNPTHIMVAPGTAEFLYDIALKLSTEFHLPVVTYICDDYYFVKSSDTILGRVKQRLLKKKIEKLMNHTTKLVMICKELEEHYSRHFGVSAITIMTGSSYPIAEKGKRIETPCSITYMGNVRCNRFYMLADIGRVLERMNEEDGSNFTLNIYTGEKNQDILENFKEIPSIKLHDFVSGSEFEKVFHSSELLLHTEAFDHTSIDLVKHSVSTKIADSLGSGICLFAYGPSEVSSMKHLLRNQCAITATSPDELPDALRTAFYDAGVREATIEKELMTAKKYHDSKVVGKYLYDVIEEINCENITD